MKLSNQSRVPAFTALSVGTIAFLTASLAAAQTAPPAAQPAQPAPTAAPPPAQPAPAPAPAEAAPPPPAQPAPAAEPAPAASAEAEGSASFGMGADTSVEAEATPAETEPAPAAMPIEEEAPVEQAAAEEVAEEEAGPAGTPSLFVFADAWAGFQTAKSGTPGGGGGVYANNGPTGTAESGFGLNWLGADLGYDGGEWGMTGSLRFGDAVATYGTGTLGPITNAYATWRPAEGLSLDLGTFGTIYGAEVAESWNNLNYTRGELYFNMQPFWHTGLRAEYAMDQLVFRALLVNAPNTSNLGGDAMNAGAQVGYDNGTFGLVAGLLQSLAPETTAANSAFIDTFVDVVLTVNAGDFSLVGNFDFNAGSEDGIAGFWGASLAAGYALTPQFGLAVRGEYLATSDEFLFDDEDGDPDTGFDTDQSLITGTLTFDVKPIEGVDNFVIRWDNRIEMASEEVYANADADEAQDTWFSSTVGVVAYADLL